MPSLIFHFFAAITLLFGALVVVSRNPVTSALSLAASFVGLAAIFIGLDAFFIGAIQVLVYAGAVMVLFLFIIMLMDIKVEKGRSPSLPAVLGAMVLAGVLLLQAAMVLSGFDYGKKTAADAALHPQQAAELADIAVMPSVAADLTAGTLPDTKLMGMQLYHRYAFHLQVVGLLLTVATVGVVVLSKREQKTGGRS